MTVEILKIPGGLEVDGLMLLRGKCGCTSLAKCCYSWSKVKQKGSDIVVEAKLSAPDTKDNFEWGYTVSKDGVTVNVAVEDARDKEIYSGYIPPAAAEWESQGWTVSEKTGEREDSVVWRCAMCKWLYKENEEGTSFEELPDDWKCPTCGAPKGEFEKIS
jgi:pyruvate oxidase